ncbi:MAG: betaine--homocysteine S-methyltransferase [Aestuariivita sp.]|nr:betaine--homocysteine S-methyltransferase [Aestuariivita sp.]
MNNALSEMLSTIDVILADGATGTNLFQMGLAAGDAPELLNSSEPSKITKLYKIAVNAGCDLFLTNTFGGNAARLKLHNAQNHVHKLNRIGAEIGREIVDKGNRKIIVAGSVGPTGEILKPVGELSHQLAVEMFHEQADGLKTGGADVLWLETISAPEELKAAVEAFALTGMPWVGTMSFDTAGRTMMGVTSIAMSEMIQNLEFPPVAYGANCGTGSADILRTILAMTTHDNKYPIISKGNAGIPKYVDGNIFYDGTPELMADYAELARNAGARIIGGCCGTTGTHLKKMREALDQRPKGSRPTLEEVTARLGGFSSESDGTNHTNEEGKTRERRRRRRD